MPTKDEVKRIADLARIRFTDGELDAFEKDFEAILDFVGTLNEVDTQGVAPTAQASGLANAWRKDPERYPADTIDRNALLDQAPQREKDYIKVKAVFE